MNIPSLFDDKIVNDDGRLTDTWKNILEQLFNELQINLSDFGIVIPKLSSEKIDSLTGMPISTMVYDTDNNVLKVKTNLGFETVKTELI